MFLINLSSLEKVNELVKICERYDTDIDIEYGRYIINGKSVLGVASLLGNIVKVIVNTNDNLLIEYFYRDLKEIGGWITN